MLGLGSCLGDLFYLSMALLGMTFVFELPPVRWALWLAGTAVLLYLAFKMARETIRPHAPVLPANGHSADAPFEGRKHFVRGIALTLSSPSAIAWFAFVAGPIVAGLNITGIPGLFAFAAGFFMASLLWSVFLAYVSSRSGRAFGPKFVRALSLVSALLFVYFAIKVFSGGLEDLLR